MEINGKVNKLRKDEELPKVSKVEHYEGESENGIIYIDIHYPIDKYAKVEGALDLYGKPEFWGKTNLSNGTSIQVFKFRITAKTLEQAVRKYEQELENNLKELQDNRNNKVVIPE